MFLSINIFWAPFRAYFNTCLMAQAKVSLSQAQNTFIPTTINDIVLLVMFTLYLPWHLLIVLCVTPDDFTHQWGTSLG